MNTNAEINKIITIFGPHAFRKRKPGESMKLTLPSKFSPRKAKTQKNTENLYKSIINKHLQLVHEDAKVGALIFKRNMKKHLKK
jgi:hypothetical protein